MVRLKDNNFSDNIKRKAGCSVGFRCTFEGCNSLLVSRKENSNDIQTTAEYCHIAAASPGGPRYDKSLSSKQVCSLDNCIVMCGKHHHIIDNNPNIYTTELLKKWKNEKEEMTRYEMINSISKVDVNQLEAIFDSYLKNGEYDILKTKLEDYKNLGDSELLEVVLRYSIFLKTLFGDNIRELIKKYIKLGFKKFNNLAIFLIEFDDKETLKAIVNYIDNSNIRQLSEMISTEDTKDIIQDENVCNLMKKCNPKLIIKYIMNYIFRSNELLCYIYDSKGNNIPFYRDEHYYNVIAFILELREIQIKPIDLNKEYVIDTISKHISFIEKFSFNIKVNSYRFILLYLSSISSELFYDYYNRLSETEKNQKVISEIYYKYRIINDSSITIDDISNYSNQTGDYKTLCVYLANNPSIVQEYIKDHMYLLKKDSAFLLLYHNCVNEEEFKSILSQLKDIYDGDFIYNCILWNLNISNDSLRKWCIDNQNKVDNYSVEIFFSNLILSNENELFFDLIGKITNVDVRASLLLHFSSKNANESKYYDTLIKEYKSIDQKKTIEGINYNLGIMYRELGKIDKAFKCLEKEIDCFKKHQSLEALFHLRLEKEYYLKDKYFEMAIVSTEYIDLAYAAEVYYHNNDFEDALVYYEKAAISGKDILGCLFKILEICNAKPQEIAAEICDGTAVTIIKEREHIDILFHKNSVIDKITSQNEKWIDACLDNPEYGNFLYGKVGEKVLFRGKKYKIQSIDNIYQYYSRIALQTVALDPRTIKFNGSIDSTINQIKEYLQEEHKQRKEMMSKYEELKAILPLSATSKVFFNNKILSNLFYCVNDTTNKILNNSVFMKDKIDCKKLIFYYDSIFILFSIYKEIKFSITDAFCITDYIKNRLINEVNDRIRNVKLDSNSLGIDDLGNMTYYSFENNKEKAQSLQDLNIFKEFINSFCVIPSSDYDIYIDGQRVTNKDIELLDEKSVFSVTQNSDIFLIVSDSIGFTNLCNTLKMKNIGISQLVTCLFDSKSIIDVALLLKKLNYNNYFTLNMYLSVRNECGDSLKKFFEHSFEKQEDNSRHILIMKTLFYYLCYLNLFRKEEDSMLIDFIYK